MNVSARRRVLAFGLAALVHAGLILIPLPRSASDPSRPGIEPAAISVELIAPVSLPGPGADPPQPAAAPEAATRPDVPAARTPTSVTNLRSGGRDARRTATARPGTSHVPENVVLAPHGAHLDRANTSTLHSMTLDVGGNAAVFALDDLSGHVPSWHGTSGPALPHVDRLAYARRLRGLVEAHKHYPARARRRGQEGEVTLRLRIAPDGRLLGQPRVTASSGADALDREALRMVQRASPFPPSGAATAIELAVPVRFSLDER